MTANYIVALEEFEFRRVTPSDLTVFTCTHFPRSRRKFGIKHYWTAVNVVSRDLTAVRGIKSAVHILCKDLGINLETRAPFFVCHPRTATLVRGQQLKANKLLHVQVSD